MSSYQELSSAKYFTPEIPLESMQAEVAAVTKESTAKPGPGGLAWLSKLIGPILVFCGVAMASMYWSEVGPAKRPVTSDDPVEHFLNHPMFRIVHGMGGIDHDKFVTKHREWRNQGKADLERKLRDAKVILRPNGPVVKSTSGHVVPGR